MSVAARASLLCRSQIRLASAVFKRSRLLLEVTELPPLSDRQFVDFLEVHSPEDIIVIASFLKRAATFELLWPHYEDLSSEPQFSGVKFYWVDVGHLNTFAMTATLAVTTTPQYNVYKNHEPSFLTNDMNDLRQRMLVLVEPGNAKMKTPQSAYKPPSLVQRFTRFFSRKKAR